MKAQLLYLVTCENEPSHIIGRPRFYAQWKAEKDEIWWY